MALLPASMSLHWQHAIRRPAQIDSREENSIAVLHFGRTTYQDNRIKLSLVPALFRRMPVNKVDELFV